MNTHSQEYEIDATTVREIPVFDRPVSISYHGCSAWAKSYKINTADAHGDDESYFMKVSKGHHGLAALMGEFESTSAIHAVVGDYAPKPVAWGSFKKLPDSHYYVCKFYELADELPEPIEFCKTVANLHTRSQSPNGKFGFHVVTYNGNLPQNNNWVDTWEKFFTIGFKHMLNMNIERGGPWEEMEKFRLPMLTKVIPRLLRPLELNGRTVKPSLVHGDLWCGNAAIDTMTEKPLIYDPASFYAHNEYELGNWRPERNKFSRSYFAEYHSHIPKSFPENDYEDRNALYSLRFNLHAAALFPDVKDFRKMAVEQMKEMVEKFPRGFDDYNED